FPATHGSTSFPVRTTPSRARSRGEVRLWCGSRAVQPGSGFVAVVQHRQGTGARPPVDAHHPVQETCPVGCAEPCTRSGSGARLGVLAAVPLPISSISRVGNLRQRRTLATGAVNGGARATPVTPLGWSLTSPAALVEPACFGV